MNKGRVFLFHWNKAEAEGYANGLRKAGWAVDLEWEDGARGGAEVPASSNTAGIRSERSMAAIRRS